MHRATRPKALKEGKWSTLSSTTEDQPLVQTEDKVHMDLISNPLMDSPSDLSYGTAEWSGGAIQYATLNRRFNAHGAGEVSSFPLTPTFSFCICLVFAVFFSPFHLYFHFLPF